LQLKYKTIYRNYEEFFTESFLHLHVALARCDEPEGNLGLDPQGGRIFVGAVEKSGHVGRVLVQIVRLRVVLELGGG